MKLADIFKKSATQSNPVFGKSGTPYYKTNDRMMALNGFVTPNQLVCYSYFNESADLVQFKGIEVEEDEHTALLNEKQFIECLTQIIDKHHARIQRDSRGRRAGFMFVTVPGNRYLKAIRQSPEFLGWANDRQAGIYMTSSPINDKQNEYEAGGQIKFCMDKTWYSDENMDRVNISDFIDVINDTVPEKASTLKLKRLALTKEITHTHINVVINIDQLNAGVNLPGLNGTFIARYLNKNNPLVKQIPGRASRPDPEDIPVIGQGNMDHCPSAKTGVKPNGEYWYVKPYSYIYICPNMFNPEQRVELQDLFNSFYDGYAMEKVIVDGNNEGAGKPEEPDNSNKKNKTVKELLSHKLPEGNEAVFDLLKLYEEDSASSLWQQVQNMYFGLPMNDKTADFLCSKMQAFVKNGKKSDKKSLRELIAKANAMCEK